MSKRKDRLESLEEGKVVRRRTPEFEKLKQYIFQNHNFNQKINEVHIKDRLNAFLGVRKVNNIDEAKNVANYSPNGAEFLLDLSKNIKKKYILETMRELKYNKNITRLILNNTIFDRQISSTLSEVIKKNKTLLFLDISMINLEYLHVFKITGALSTNSTIKHLKLKQTNIIDDGGLRIASMLFFNTSIISIDLSNNHLQDRECVAIAKALKVNKTLQNISLSNNEMDNNSATAFAEMLKINTTLTELALEKCDLDEGSVAILKSLENNTTLTHINLRLNDMDYDKAIAKLIKVNNTLTHIDISENTVGRRHDDDDGTVGKSFIDALKENQTLQYIVLDKSFFTNEDHAVLEKDKRVKLI